jgi:hypothetical protein
MGLQRVSYQRRKSAGPTSGNASSYWPTPTFKSAGNRVCFQPYPCRLKLLKDEAQAGNQFGLRNAASAWTVMWDFLLAMGWTPRSPVSSLPFRVHLKSGEWPLRPGPSLNPEFTDWMMGWPPGWTDPLRPVTGWSRWLQHARGGC